MVAGIVAGGLLGLALAYLQLPWQTNLLILALSAVLLGVLVLRAEFPVTERVAQGFTYDDMFRELFDHQVFCVMFW